MSMALSNFSLGKISDTLLVSAPHMGLPHHHLEVGGWVLILPVCENVCVLPFTCEEKDCIQKHAMNPAFYRLVLKKTEEKK